MQTIIPAHLAQFLRPLRASAPVVAPADRTPVFTPSQSGSAPRNRRALPEMPEIESHDDVTLCDNNVDFLSIGQEV